VSRGIDWEHGNRDPEILHERVEGFRSSGAKSVSAVPLACARPVRPTRWT